MATDYLAELLSQYNAQPVGRHAAPPTFASGNPVSGLPSISGGSGGSLESLAGQLAPEAEAAAASAGRSGVLGKLGLLTGAAAKETPLIAEGARFATGIKGLGLGVAGDLAGKQIESHVPGTAGRVGGMAAKGAGIGAGFGLLGGPFAELSVPAGAGLGALAGGALGLLGIGGDGKKKGKEAEPVDLHQVLSVSGADVDTQREVLSLYNTLVALGYPTSDTTGKDGQVTQGATTLAGNLLLQRLQEAHQQKQDTATMLASQAMASQFFAPVTEQLTKGANQRAGIYNQLAGSLPEEYRALATGSAADEVQNANRLAAAYASQTQLIGPMQVMAEQLARQKQVEAQAFSQSLSGGGSGGDFAALLQQAQGAG